MSSFQPEGHSSAAGSDGSSNGNNMNGKVMAGAATAGAIAGLVVSGPILAVAAAGGAAYATTRTDGIGSAATATGNAALAAGSGLKKFNEEHKVTDTVAKGTQQAVQGVRQYDQEHQVGQKIKGALNAAAAGTQQAWNSAQRFEQEHKIGERVQTGAKSALDNTRKFEQEHQIGRKVGGALASIGNGIGSFFQGKSGAQSSDQPQRSRIEVRFPKPEERDWRCNICRDTFGPLSRVAVLPCGHVYHQGCSSRWLATSATCPTCRHDLGPALEERR